MGVYYDISGEFEIAPPVSEKHRDLVNTDHWRSVHGPSRFEPWIISDDGAVLTVEDDEHKNCYDEETNLVRLFTILTRLGHYLRGEIFVETSEDGNWRYEAGQGVLFMSYGEIKYDTPQPLTKERKG